MSRDRRRAALVLAGMLLGPAAAQGQIEALVPLAPGQPLALGAAWDSDTGAALEGAGCVEHAGEVRVDGGATTWTLVTLSRAGGRLLLGVHAGSTVASEGMRGPHLTDAARRLARTDPDAFAELCGEGYVAARAWGAQYVGEIEIDPAAAPRASAVLRTGVWTDPAVFRAALEAVIGVAPARARELPNGRRADAVPIEPDALLARALALPETVDEASARPYLAAVRPYPSSALSGIAFDSDPREGWGDAARFVFLRSRATSSSAAARAAEMRKAQVQRVRPEPAPPARAPSVASAPARAAPAPAPGAARVDGAAAAAPAPSSAAAASSPAAPAHARVQRLAALVFAPSPGPPVFATTTAPPGVHAERAGERQYWIPGVAVATPAVRAALAAAREVAPVRGTTVVLVEVGDVDVVMTDAAPGAGVHSVPAGDLRAWIAGVREPTPAQRDALDAAVRAAAP